MNFDAYWERLCKVTPALQGWGKMTMDIAVFREVVKRAFEMGKKEAQELKNVADDFKKVGKSPVLGDFEDIFSGLFKGKPK